MSKKSAKRSIETSNPCCVYDITLFDEVAASDVREIFKGITKKYTFQKEKGEETGVMHYQCRISLTLKERKPAVVKKLQQLGLKKFHVTITSKANRDNDFYVLKEDTRVDGPYTDINEVFIPWDIQEIKELLPWQQATVKMVSGRERRKVHVIFDPRGNNGKTILTRYMAIHNGAGSIPFCRDYKDLMRMAYQMRHCPIMLIDMPRSIPKDKLEETYAAIETVKGGYVFDERNKFKYEYINPPQIIVFTNIIPNLSLLSLDRWNIMTIRKSQLVPLMDSDDSSSDEGLDMDVDFLPSEEEHPKVKKRGKKIINV